MDFFHIASDFFVGQAIFWILEGQAVCHRFHSDTQFFTWENVKEFDVCQTFHACSLDGAIQAAGVKRLTDIKLFDVFSGEKLGIGMKSMAYSLTFQNPEDSLTDEEVARYMEKIQASLEEKVDAEVR